MIPGPTIIKQCSSCAQLIADFTALSGNTFGATFWTDGKRDAPMLQESLLLVVCPHCGARLWLGELTTVGLLEYDSEDGQRYETAQPGTAPTLGDYLAELALDSADRERKRYLRLRAWWAGNDSRRLDPRPLPMTAQEEANLTALAQELDEADVNDLVMKAEVMRELGRFDHALEFLAKSVDVDVQRAVQQIRGLAQARDSYVRQLT